MTKRLYHALVALICIAGGGTILGVALSSTTGSLWIALVIGSCWLILGALAWRDSRRARAEGQRFRTPRTGIYQVLPPPTYVRDRQYPQAHFDIVEKGPQNPIE